MPLKTERFNIGFVGIEDFLVLSKLASSKSEVKRLLKAKAVHSRGFKRGKSDTDERFSRGDVVGDSEIVQVGREFRQAKFPDAPTIGIQVLDINIATNEEIKEWLRGCTPSQIETLLVDINEELKIMGREEIVNAT